MKAYEAMRDIGRDDRTALDAACGACTLPAKPMREVSIVQELAIRPDPLLDFVAMPYWLMSGIGVQRLSARGPF